MASAISAFVVRDRASGRQAGSLCVEKGALSTDQSQRPGLSWGRRGLEAGGLYLRSSIAIHARSSSLASPRHH